MLDTQRTAGETMTTHELVRHLRERGVELRVHEGKLNVSGPRGVVDETLQAELRARKAEIVAALENGADAEPDAVSLPPGMHPLSDIQNSIWYLESEQPELGVYNLYFAEELTGELDVNALAFALQALLKRHHILRTVLAEHDGQLVQRITEAPDVDLRIENLEREGDSRLAIRLQQELVRSFDQRNGPLYRYKVFRLASRRHVLLFAVDHVVADGMSMAILHRELFELYAARRELREPRLPKLDTDYLSLVEEERRWLRGPQAQRQLEFWKTRLAGELPQLELPTDQARPAMSSGQGDAFRLTIDTERLATVTTIARAGGASPFMFISAVIALLLARLAGQREIVLGMPFANRTRKGSETVVGLFINPVAIRVRIDGEETFNDLLRQVRDRCMEAFDNQSMPFDRVVEAIAPRRDSSRTPVFQALVTHLPDADRSGSSAGLVHRPIGIRRGTAQTDIAFWCRDTDTGLSVDLEYSADVFTAKTARRMLQRFDGLLAELTEQPATRISDVSLLLKEERERLLSEWCSGPMRNWPSSTVDALLRKACERNGSSPASGCGERQLSYDEMGALADRVAAALKEQGVGRGDVVGVMLERDERLPAALLGVLDRGAAYLPLDAEAPVERLQWMLEDAGVSTIVTGGPEDFAKLPPGLDAVDLDALPPAPADTESLRVVHDPDDIAYVIYTSGSTGKPKGVMVPHGTVTNFLHAMKETLEVSAHDRFLALTTLTFDIAVLELLLPLSLGAFTEIVPREVTRDGDALVKRMDESRPSVIQATPATWQLLLNAGWKGDANLLALSGGEALPTSLARALLGRARDVFNLYGPTETTVWSTAERVNSNDDPVSIGRPIANTQVYVLDDFGQLTPPGVPGELYIAGYGVTRGYLNRDELTAERFVRDPFSPATDARMYRTGDRARFLEDGRLECLGRVDFQIKLRGHRIEPGEIENALESNEAVKRAVVIVHEFGSGAGRDPRLVAYMTLADGARASIEGLRRHLRRRLPAYMLPQHFMDIDVMPLTPSGKIDRKALPSPLITPRSARVPPSTPAERCIATLWQEALGIGTISADDNFFDLGGHSLSSMKVIARIDEELGVRLRPRLLVLNSLREIAAACDEMGGRSQERTAPPPQKARWKTVVNALLGKG